MEISNYFRLIKHRALLIIAVAIVAGVVTFVIIQQQPIQFQAKATVQIGSFQELPNPDPNLVADAQGLAATYFVLARTSDVLQAVIDRGKLPISQSRLSKSLTMELVPQTPFFTITATYTDPQVAANMANAMADELVTRTPTNIDADRKQQTDRLQSQIDTLSQQLDANNKELTVIANALRDGTGDITALIQRQNDVSLRVVTQQSNLAQLSSNLITLQGRGSINVLKVLEAATVPTQGIGDAPQVRALEAAAGGAVAIIAILVLFEYLSSDIKDPFQLALVTNSAIVGIIPPYGNKRSLKKRLVVSTKPKSRAAEAYRVLRTNLAALAKNERVFPFLESCYLVTSARDGEGKSITAANLAASFALAGQNVALIDANLRKPTLHKLFSLQNNKGFSDILKIQEGGVFWTGNELPLQKTALPQLSVITAGRARNDDPDLLQNTRIADLIDLLRHNLNFDLVIFDTPPVLDYLDTIELANVSAGAVILVVEAGRTKAPEIQSVVQRLSSLSIPIAGAVMNRSQSSWVNLAPAPSTARPEYAGLLASPLPPELSEESSVR